MSTTRRIQFSIDIAAPVAQVYRLMLDPQNYREWTRPFAEGCYFEGSWQEGEQIRFLAPGGDGMLSEIAVNRPGEFVSIRHLGCIYKGVADTDSDAARSWAQAYENYSFITHGSGTRLVIDQDANAEFEQYLTEAWPRALELLKALCEAEQLKRSE